MKLTEAQIWQCNNDGEGGVHICLDHQNVVDFVRAIEREIGFAKAELWLKRINEAVLSEREECAKVCDDETFRCEAAAERAESDEVSAIRSTAWKISVCADAIRARTTP